MQHSFIYSETKCMRCWVYSMPLLHSNWISGTLEPLLVLPAYVFMKNANKTTKLNSFNNDSKEAFRHWQRMFFELRLNLKLFMPEAKTILGNCLVTYVGCIRSECIEHIVCSTYK